MKKDTLTENNDPMGAAILDYQRKGRTSTLHVLSSMFDDDVMPVAHLFRQPEDMPLLEQKALSLATGRILDVGAGAGCHALALQQAGKTVKAIDISPLSCEAMRLRGINDVRCINLFDDRLDRGYDTILLLMNGTGIAGKISNLPALFARLRQLLNPGGQILIDSSDLKYIYENEDGSFDIDLNAPYYGEVDYQMTYRNIQSDSFDWLYVDYPLLQSIAHTSCLHAELIAEGPHYDYLARLFSAY